MSDNEEERPAGYVQFVYCDVEANEFVTLGVAGWLTEAEVLREFTALPAVEESDIVADRLDADETIVEDRYVTRETVEAKLGEPFDVLLARGKAENRRRQAEFQALVRNR